MSFTDAVSRVSQIYTDMTHLQSAFVPPALPSSATTAAGSSSGAGVAAAPAAATFSSALSSALGTTQTDSSAALPHGAQAMLTTGQQTFAARLAADTGLDPGVVSAWLLAEESGGAAVSRQSAQNNDWLNIGYTDGGTYGSADSVWSDPTPAADATAGWLKGQSTIPGYGIASGGIRAILSTVGQPPATQITALQSSGWASGGYPSLPSIYRQLVG